MLQHVSVINTTSVFSASSGPSQPASDFIITLSF
jgi:hypothetical protein